MENKEHKGRGEIVIEQLLRELRELRELDRRRNAHAPGSAAREAATLEVDRRGRQLMDRFRDLKKRPTPDAPQNGDVRGPMKVKAQHRNRSAALT